MIKKRLGKILKLGGLIGVRQSYKLARNWYQIYYQPEMIIRELRESRDKSQIFLIVTTALSPLLIYIVVKVIWDLIKYRELLWVWGKGLNLVLGLEAMIFSYLAYFLLKVNRKN